MLCPNLEKGLDNIKTELNHLNAIYHEEEFYYKTPEPFTITYNNINAKKSPLIPLCITELYNELYIIFENSCTNEDEILNIDDLNNQFMAYMLSYMSSYLEDALC